MATDFIFPIHAGLSPTGWLKRLREFLGFEKDPLKWNRDEAADTLQYISRLERLRTPDPLEGQVIGGPNPCFFLRTFSGEREIFWIDTKSKGDKVIPVSFLASYNGKPEYYPNMEIGTPKD